MYNIDFTTPRWLIIYYHSVSFTSIILNSLGFYLTTFECQKMNKYRYYLLSFQVSLVFENFWINIVSDLLHYYRHPPEFSHAAHPILSDSSWLYRRSFEIRFGIPCRNCNGEIFPEFVGCSYEIVLGYTFCDSYFKHWKFFPMHSF